MIKILRSFGWEDWLVIVGHLILAGCVAVMGYYVAGPLCKAAYAVYGR